MFDRALQVDQITEKLRLLIISGMLLQILTKSQERLRSPDVKVTDVAVQLLKVSLPISCYVGLFIDVSRGSGPKKWSDAPNDDASSYYSNNKCCQRPIMNNLITPCPKYEQVILNS